MTVEQILHQIGKTYIRMEEQKWDLKYNCKENLNKCNTSIFTKGACVSYPRQKQSATTRTSLILLCMTNLKGIIKIQNFGQEQGIKNPRIVPSRLESANELTVQVFDIDNKVQLQLHQDLQFL